MSPTNELQLIGRTKFVRDWVEISYPDAHRISRVMDNRNTHCGASLYKAFEPDEALQI